MVGVRVVRGWWGIGGVEVVVGIRGSEGLDVVEFGI